MTENPQEIEIKFYLTDPGGFIQRLSDTGADLMSARCKEVNFLFDNVNGSLQKIRAILRLRKDTRNRLTFKGAGEVDSGVVSRRELEVDVSDFDMTRQLLEALGYFPYLIYEKFRTTYTLNKCEVVLDELPFGWFCEIEGASPQAILATARKLSLTWNARILDSYRMLFYHCKQAKGLGITNLTFEDFEGLAITSQDLGVKPGDGSNKGKSMRL
jgi:adenylate cyclase class 2